MPTIFENKRQLDFYIYRLEHKLEYCKISEMKLIKERMGYIDNLCIAYKNYEELYNKEN